MEKVAQNSLVVLREGKVAAWLCQDQHILQGVQLLPTLWQLHTFLEVLVVWNFN